MLRKHNPQKSNLKGSFKKLLMVLVMLGGVIQMNAQNTSQTITLNLRNVSIQEFMKQIESRTNFTFIYRDILMDTKKDVSIQVSNKPLVEVVKTVLDQKGLEASYNNNTIVLTKKKEVAKPASKTISGVVTDASGEPIIGATVMDVNSTEGTITDFDGRFTLSLSKGENIQISYVGYKSETINTSGKSTFSVILKEDIANLEEVVVVGYGTQKKVNLTGAVSVVSADQIQNRPSGSVVSLLQGAVPNLNVNMTSGRPGGSGTLNIRGATSINGGSPLVLIDGIEASLEHLNPNDIASVTVLKDASASAIYGARAAYGVILVTTISKDRDSDKIKVSYNGSYGIGRSTTSTDFETRGYYSVYINDLFYRTTQGVNYSKYTEADMLELWARRNDKTEDPTRPWVVTQNRAGKESYIYYANTDWYHYLYNENRPMQKHNISLSGGNDKVKFLVSGGFHAEDGIMRMNTDKYKKANLRSKVTADINKYISISNNTSFYRNSYTFPGSGAVNNSFVYQNVHGLASYVPVNPDGTPVYMTIFNSAGVMDGWSALITHGKHANEDTYVNLTNIAELTIRPFKGLEIKGNFSYAFNGYTAMNRSVNIPYSMYPGELSYVTSGRGDNKLNEKFNRNEYYATNIFATYKKSIRDHNLSLLGGFNYETRSYKDIGIVGWNLLSDDLNDMGLTAIDETTGMARFEGTGGQNEYAIMGGFGRFNYDYQGKYLLEISGRNDGSSKFMRGLRYVFFPSFSAGWRMSEEKFFNPLSDIIDNMKLRVSYGSLGNQNVTGYYPYIRTVSTSTLDYVFGTDAKGKYASFSAPVASNISWEVVTTSNLGFDLGFFDSKLNFNADFYIRDTEGMLVKGKTLPSVYGTTPPRENAADLRTKGYELVLSWNDKFTLASKPFSYGVTLSLGDNTAKITRFDNPNKMLNDYYEGQTWGEIWGYKTDGLFASDEEAANWSIDQTLVNQEILIAAGAEGKLRAGDVKFVDLNNDNKITQGENRVGNSGDQVVIGNSQARYRYGISANASWNGIDISVFLQGIGKQNWWPSNDAYMFWGPYNRPYATFIHKDFMKDVWTEDNPDAYFPRHRGYAASGSASNRSLRAPTDRYLQDLAYLRLKNLTVGYTLPTKLVNKVALEKLRFYFSGENLLTFSKIHSKVVDPEQASAEGEASSKANIYPFQKIFSVNIDITF